MEIAKPPQKFRVDSAVLDVFPVASMSSNPFVSAADDVAGNPFLTTALTAPPSPNPFELLPPGTAGADPFDLFQHFTSAPASPTRAAAIYAQFSSVDDGNSADHDRDGGDNDDDSFLHRLSYSTPTVNSTVPFDWEEKPGKPKKAVLASSTATVPFGWEEKPGKPKAVFASATANREDTDFDFGVLLDRTSRTLEPAAADELFDEGKIRPLKPPPRLLDSGSVGSSPRSAKSASMWSPRRRNLVGSGADFDPFAAAMAKASRAPSPLGAAAKLNAADAETHTTVAEEDPGSAAPPPPTVAPPTDNNGWRKKKWRLSDLLLFRKLSAKGRAAGTGSISKDPVFKYAPMQRLGTTPAKNVTAAEPGNVVSSAGKHKKHGKPVGAEGGGTSSAAPRRQSMVGCVRLNPSLQRLTKGINVPSTHFRRRAGRTSTTTMGK